MIRLYATRPTLAGSLAGTILAPQRYTTGTVWRAHGRWCAGPSTLPLAPANLAGLQLAPADDFLTCALRYCDRREELLRIARADPRLLWLTLEAADDAPLSAAPTSLRAALESGERDVARLAAAGPGRVERVPAKAWSIAADGTRRELPDVVWIAAEFPGPRMGPH
jgi:hypothetical protein